MRWWIVAVVISMTTACAKRPGGSAEERLLVAAVKTKGAASADAARSGDLCSLAESHLDYMISRDAISHDEFSSRNEKIQSLGGTGSGEIVASNCGIDSVEAAAKRCADSWEDSSGHRDLMHQSWASMCYQLKRSETGCWFCIGLFANGL